MQTERGVDRATNELARPEPRSVRSDRRGVARRRAILDAATEVFGRRGFRNGSLAEVAAQAGVTAAGVLYHYGSKDDLLFAVIRDRDRRMAQIIGDATPDVGLSWVLGSVLFAEISEQERNLTALQTVLEIESLDRDSTTYEYFTERNRYLVDNAAASLRAAQEKGEIRPELDCVWMAHQIVAFMHGAAMMWLRDPEISLARLYRGYFDNLLRSIKT